MVTFDMLLREAVENRGWLREFEEKIEQLTSEKQQMVQEKQEMECKATLEKQEVERKAALEKQQMELEKQEMIRRMIEDGVPLEKAEKWAGCKMT